MIISKSGHFMGVTDDWGSTGTTFLILVKRP